jgi:hypothetical protein
MDGLSYSSKNKTAVDAQISTFLIAVRKNYENNG